MHLLTCRSSQDSKKLSGPDATKENNIDNTEKVSKEDQKALADQQEERKMRKEAKEFQQEEFYREKFQFAEQQILNEMTKYSAIISEVPLGRDRTFRRYWNFMNVDGMYVENDDEGALKITELDDNETEDEFTEDEDGEADEVRI